MCCFSVATPIGLFARLFAPRVEVSRTNIYARMIEPGIQALAYGMDLASARDVAMVLPLPVIAGGGEDAVRFVDLSAHPQMFRELAELFEGPLAGPPEGGMVSRGGAKPLAVREVGAFVASYVPTHADFSRLDPRFRVPEVLFEAVPEYVDYGFAVFQLGAGSKTIHPMAFTFPTRSPDRLFFPTVHVHDGKFHRVARFDHALYYQAESVTDPIGAARPDSSYNELVERARPLARRTLRAKLPNVDTWITSPR
ncbi:MAG: hypothetical protein WKG01_38395 [Kofleriaceae bacterium]